MPRESHALIGLVLLSLLVRVAEARPSDTWREALQAAQRNAAEERGADFADAVRWQMLDRYTDAMAQCATSAPKRGASFDLLIQLSVDGTVRHALASRSTRLSECLLQRVRGDQYLVPPQADYWVLVPRAQARCSGHAAANEIDDAKSWQDFVTWMRRFRYPCDEIDVSELWSEFVTQRLAHRWDELGVLDTFVRAEPHLLALVVDYVSAVGSTESDLRTILVNARTACPPAARHTCQRIAAAAKRTLATEF